MEPKTKKRRLFGGEHVYESRQEEDCKKTYGDGVAWLRGPMIGKGSFGRVFVANVKSRYSLYPPIMAVKSAHVSASASIQKEKEVLDNIRGCSNVIKCFGEEVTIGDEGQMVYNMLLEYGSGGTLADLINNSDGVGLPELDVRRHARSILLGLSHIHKRGFVHCDLKPENVLLVAGKTGGHFIAKIGDFGLAKRTKQIKKNCYGKGTLMYLSPEALINGVQEQPADIWAFGCIVFEMLTGKPLWFSNQDLGNEEILARIGNEIDLLSVSSSVSAEGKSFLKHCLAQKVMCRLTANMLLNHPFLKGLRVNEAEESHEVFDINSITSALLSFNGDEEEDDELWLSTCADAHVTPSEENISAGVQRLPVRLITIS